MAGVTVAAVAKKVVAAIASNKKGRKFLGYVIGITLFILCIPIIVLFCVFGWTAGSTEQFDPQAAVAGAIRGITADMNQEVNLTIEELFFESDLPIEDVHKAQMVALFYLRDRENEYGFYTYLLECFSKTTADKTVYDLLENKFEIEITEKDRAMLDGMYGVTPARKPAEGG